MDKEKIWQEFELEIMRQKQSEARVEILKMRLSFEVSEPSTPKKNDIYHDYCKKNRVEPEDQELVLRRSMTKEEVAKELGESTSTIYRLLKKNILRRSDDSRNRKIKICTISIYEYLQFGNQYGSTPKTKK